MAYGPHRGPDRATAELRRGSKKRKRSKTLEVLISRVLRCLLLYHCLCHNHYVVVPTHFTLFDECIYNAEAQ